MIEELLLAMDGYPGDLFYPASNSSNSEESKWRVAPELVDSLHPGEEELVSKLLILSNYVFQFKKFAEIYGPAAFLRQVVPRTDGSTAAETNATNGGHIARNGSSPTFGAYAACLGEGFSSMLEDYRSILIHLEQTLCNNGSNGYHRPSNALSTIFSELLPYFRIFPIVDKVRMAFCDGNPEAKDNGQILSYVAEVYESERGDLAITSALESYLLRRCIVPFTKHLLNWLATGRLESDAFGEFFIRAAKGTTFVVQREFVPSFVSASVAAKILFIGNSVNIIAGSSESKEDSMGNWKALISPLSSFLASYASRRSSNGGQVRYEDLAVEVESNVENVRSAAAEKLYAYCFQDTNAVAVLDAWVKNAFFLGKGELFLAFIDAGETLLSTSLGPVNQLETNTLLLANCWSTALGKIYWQNDQEEEYFNGIIPKFDSDLVAQSKGGGIALDAIKLQMEAPQRLSPLLTTSFFGNLNRVFRFLLRWRRTQSLIESCWLTLKKSPSSEVQRMPNLEKIHQLTALMLFVVKNLQYYIHVEVLESIYAKTIKQVIESKDFERVLHVLHGDMIDEVFSRCFLKPRDPNDASNSQMIRNVGKVLKAFRENCDSFSALVLDRLKDSLELTTDSLSEADSTFACRVHESYVNYQRTTALLFKLLTSSKCHDPKSGLAHLLVRLDFNNYFSSMKLFST